MAGLTPPDWEGLFRREYPVVVAGVAKRLGRGRLDVAEDAAQEALARAVADWRVTGTPENPGAWLSAVAWRCAIDALRQSSRERPAVSAEPAAPQPERRDIEDDALRLVFLCVHPSLPREDQIALTLKAACGLGTAEIARAFFGEEAALAQRLVRAKRRLRDEAADFEMPAAEELPGRLDAVLDVIYLTFNEGYSPRGGEQTLRTGVAHEALRLVRLVADHPVCGAPRADALAALLCLQASRLPARLSNEGELVPLEEQDRSRWDIALVSEGLSRLSRAGRGESLSEYHVLAGIAACHAAGRESDWTRIASLYAELERRTPTWIVRLNRAVAISYADGPAAGLAAIDALSTPPAGAIHAFHAARADALRRMGRIAESAEAHRSAAAAAPTEVERRWHLKKSGH